MYIGPNIFPQSWNEWVDRQNIPWVSESWHEERRKQAEIEAAIARAENIPSVYQEPPRYATLGPDARDKGAGTFTEEAEAELRGEKEEKEMDLMEQAFLMSMMESMRGEDIGQAPAVVAGGGQRQWPSMMGQFAPWEQQKPYWWIA